VNWARSRNPIDFFFIGILCFIIETGCMNNKQKIQTGLPKEVNAWKEQAQPKEYTQENLYSYINGGAELYLSYGFKKALHQVYTRKDQPDIIADVFNMGTSYNAFGVFCHSRESVENDFGQGSQYTAGLLIFWKDKYYVSILAHPETPEAKKAVFDLARGIEQSIPENGPLPAILKYLPKEGLNQTSIRYFYNHAWQNTHYFISDSNLLNINKTTPAVLAKYGKQVLMVVQYGDETGAKTALKSIRKEFLPELLKADAAKDKAERWSACKQVKHLVVVALNSDSKKESLELLKVVEKEINKLSEP
jgi:hypothetical protein